MAVRESWVPGEGPRFRVVGDLNGFRNFSTRQEADQREAELVEPPAETDD